MARKVLRIEFVLWSANLVLRIKILDDTVLKNVDVLKSLKDSKKKLKSFKARNVLNVHKAFESI